MCHGEIGRAFVTRLPPSTCHAMFVCRAQYPCCDGRRARLFENITAVSTTQRSAWPGLILDSPFILSCPVSICNRAISTCHLLFKHFQLHAFTLFLHVQGSCSVVVTLTEQLPASPSPLLSRPQHPPTTQLNYYHPAQSLQVTSLFAHPHANTHSALHFTIRPRAPSSFTALTCPPRPALDFSLAPTPDSPSIDIDTSSSPSVSRGVCN